MTSGLSLLESFREHRSEAAFDALVRRYSGLIFSAARRRVGDAALAEDVAQSVFVRLARTPPKVTTEAELAGWLHRTTLHVSIDHWRSESRRRTRENIAGTMLNSSNEPEPQLAWNELAPHLDEAVDDLPEPDRQAILLRFFERRSMRELGEHLGVSEAAAKMRISRSLEKLRLALAAKGIACGTALLGSTLSDRAIDPVSETLVARWSSVNAALLRGSVASRISASGKLSTLLSSLAGVRLALLVAGVLVAGWGVHRWNNRSAASALNLVSTPADRTEAVPADPAGVVLNPATRLQSRGPAATANRVDLDEARRLLRAVLQAPLSARGYPPPALTEALARFGDQLSEAMPILVEASRVDYETKVWALSGIQYALGRMQWQGQAQAYEDALVLARPVLGAVLLEERASGMLKMFALSSLLPPVIEADIGPGVSVSPDAESLSWIERALHSTPGRNRDDGFRFTIIDQLLDPRRKDESVQSLIQGLAPMLVASSPEDRLVAAYALAMAPGEKPAAVKSELLKALRETSTDSYRAARAVSGLGPDAADTVPMLLAFAKQTKDWGDGGYARAALESACRLQPELRADYPEIDQTLKREEQAQERMAHPKGIREQILEWAAAGDEVVLEALTSPIRDAPESEAPRNLEGFTRILQTEMAGANAEERLVLERVLDLVRTADLRPRPQEEESAGQRSVDVRNLILDARILLANTRHADADRIQQALERFQTEQVNSGNFSTVTRESFAALAKVLGDIDPQFRSAWHQVVLEENPQLDRIIPKAGR